MREYETVFILHPQVDEAGIEREIGAITQTITDGKGEVSGVYKWGRRRLAYPIGKVNDGTYTLVRFRADASVLRELDRRYKINESILRHMTVHAVGDPTAPELRSRGLRPDRPRGRGGDRREDGYGGGVFDDSGDDEHLGGRDDDDRQRDR